MTAKIYTIDFQDTTKTGLSLSFTTYKKVSDNSPVSAPIITELGDGFYKYTFDMDTVDSDLYFVADDGGTENVVTGRINLSSTDTLNEILFRIVGLTQENMFVDNTSYSNGILTVARVRIYTDSASVGTASNVLATYNITANETGGVMDDYKSVKA